VPWGFGRRGVPDINGVHHLRDHYCNVEPTHQLDTKSCRNSCESAELHYPFCGISYPLLRLDCPSQLSVHVYAQILVTLDFFDCFTLQPKNTIFSGWVQFKFKSKINCITVDLCSFSFIPPLLPSPSPCHLGLNLVQQLGKGPSHLLRDVGPTNNDITYLRSKDVPIPAPPLSKGMWAVHVCLTKSLGKEIHEGGPRYLEVCTVRNEKQTMTFIMVHLSLISPPISPH